MEGRKYWTQEEDEKLIQYVNTYGKGKWKTVAKNLGIGKTGSSCSQRYNNHLRPGLVRGDFTEEEKHKILILYSQLGNKWAKIARHLTGRTDNAVKNFCNTHLAKETRLTEKKQASAVVPPPKRGGRFDVFSYQDGGPVSLGSYEQQLGNHGGSVHPSPPPVTFPDHGVGVSYDHHQLGSGVSPPRFPLPDTPGNPALLMTAMDVSYDYQLGGGGGGGVHRVYPSPPRFPLPDTFGLSYEDLHGGGSISFPGSTPFDYQLGNNDNPIIGHATIGPFITLPPWNHNTF